MKLKTIILTTILSLSFGIYFFSCKQSQYKPLSTGVYNQVTVVSDSVLYQDFLFDVINDSLFFGRQFEGIFFPPEQRLVSRNFEYSIFRKYKGLRNILFFQEGKPAIQFVYDSITKPQSFIIVTGNSKEDFEIVLRQNQDSIVNSFVNADQKHIIQKLRKRNIKTKPWLDSIGLSMIIPKSYNNIKTTPDFTWYRSDINEDILNLMFYSIDAIDSIGMSEFLQLRNSYNRRHVEGADRDDFAKTDTLVPVSIKTIFKSKKIDIFEMRGNWSMEIEMMGGPFITRVIHDKEKKKLYFADAFIFAPNVNYANSSKSKKRTYLLQLESLLSTFNLNTNK